jgi:hypothetical protein
MQTYRATFRLCPAEASTKRGILGTCPVVTITIRDFGLHHAAARAAWRLPTIAAAHGWHPGRTELIAVELAGEDESPVTTALSPDVPTLRALGVARHLTGCDEEAGRLVAAAGIMAGGWG